MTFNVTRVAAGSSLLGIGGLAGVLLAPRGAEHPRAPVQPATVVRTVYIKRVHHRTIHVRPKPVPRPKAAAAAAVAPPPAPVQVAATPPAPAPSPLRTRTSGSHGQTQKPLRTRTSGGEHEQEHGDD